ncbi:hypothetical protein [Salimicrobium flavidum]|uniref:Uncharacterized protein n=1 Tax=Salimicrobium flavidum TaxID=570947 RepID=A0A1N7JXP6_9BACI|nr:hypothetical protein [Salimicrobium flavidum]SIS54100.1 hypothetical protein SAMN05421687_10831 [Salimicrobium flavidum]
MKKEGIDALATNAKQPLKVERDAHINEIAERLVGDWCLALWEHGHTPTPSENMFAYQTFKLWQQTGVLDLPVIVGAQPGYGKSTMLTVFLRYMVRNQPNTFGAIVVKERVEDIKRLADEINEEGTQNGLTQMNNYAYYIRGYNSEEMTREHYEEQFTTQAQYNVVIMTTKQFELQALRDKLGKFGRFKDSRGMNRPRRTLLIDEKPSLVVSHKLGYDELNGLKSKVIRASHEATGDREPYVDKVLSLVNEVSQSLEAHKIPGRFRYDPIKPNYMIPRKLLGHFAEVFGVSDLQELRAFERVVGYGGELNFQNGRIEIVSTFYLHYEITEYNTFIMDGTGDLDPEYIGRDFNLFMPEQKPDLTNVTFHLCKQYGMSKTSIREHNPKSIENISAEIKRIVEGEEGKTLIVTNAEFVPQLEQKVPASEYNVVFKHYDGGRGTNNYADADNAIFIGVLNKGSSYYATAAQAVAGDRLGETLGIEQEKSGGRYRFTDERVEEYKSLDVAVEMVQETHRIRANKKTKPVNIYVFYNDERTLQHITEAYEGATIREHKPVSKLIGAETTADAIVRYFREMETGEQIKQSRIYKDLDVHRNTFTKAVETDRVVQAMKEMNVTKEKTKYIKEER